MARITWTIQSAKFNVNLEQELKDTASQPRSGGKPAVVQALLLPGSEVQWRLDDFHLRLAFQPGDVVGAACHA